MKDVFTHYKGGKYRMLLRDVTDCDTGEPHVIYVSLDNGAIYSRSQSEFYGDVFDKDGFEVMRYRPD